MSRILVTGGAGMIGSHVVEAFLRRGDEVVVVDNLCAGRREFLPPGVPLWKLDIRDPAIVYSGFDGVIHLAADPFIPESYVRPRQFFDVNAYGTLQVLLQAKKAGVKKIVIYSSSEIYGTALATPMREDHPTLPLSTYAVSKLAADRLAWTLFREHKVPVVIHRQFNVFGPRCNQPYVIPEIIKQLLVSPRLVLGNLDARRDFTFASDSALAACLLFDHGVPGEVYNTGTGIPRRIEDIARDIARLMGIEPQISIDTNKLRPADVMHLEADASKIRALGWQPQTTWEEGLLQTISWWRAETSRAAVRPGLLRTLTRAVRAS